jgi:hypothetical protein
VAAGGSLRKSSSETDLPERRGRRWDSDSDEEGGEDIWVVADPCSPEFGQVFADAKAIAETASGNIAAAALHYTAAAAYAVAGGLAVVTIGTCALFTVFTGASGVTIIALGGVLMPALVKNGYPERFSMGLIAGTGSVGLLFPPALPLFIYGTVYGLNARGPVGVAVCRHPRRRLPRAPRLPPGDLP